VLGPALSKSTRLSIEPRATRASRRIAKSEVVFSASQSAARTSKPRNMAKLDAQVAAILDAGSASDDEDALIASLEDSPALDAFREQRIQQLHSEFSRAKAQKSDGFGNYTEIKEEKALMELTTSVKFAVVHFAKDDFARCGVMDGHLEVGALFRGNGLS